MDENMLKIRILKPIDNLCDYTFNFCWNDSKLQPEDVIPSQEGTSFTYADLVAELKAGRDVCIDGNAGKRLAYSAGTDLKHLGGTGGTEKAGNIFVEGDVGPEAGMGMASGSIYIKGNIEEPWGNILEVTSDVEGYRKFRSITDLISNGPGKDTLKNNSLSENTLKLNDGILRGTVGARCNWQGIILVEGDVYNGTGVLMQQGTIMIKGDAGMNTGSHLDGGTVVVHGSVGEFSGAYMKDGRLIFINAKGYVGAGMTGGAIYSKKKVSTSPPAVKARLEKDDIELIRRTMETGRVESMLYNKYEPEKEKEKFVTVHMRDGSIVMRRI
ncbi:formylmethanofuran dehydrogenase [Methanomethylovorans sp. PtaU1.Bin093]|uniref:GltB/FmdC/FwdC-like GXGXG domain-containing protein n=1 Tax=Methanomethylovorans sp. PtaU1.Bin093 TaxID=1811679 RepID=UPI0025E37E72|nr:formylmethanofuran dehydrogenase [Methanomethylovorans sp. PtaU1.Bin093]